jgi:hypothetical protein
VNLPYVKRGYYLAKCDWTKLSADNQTVANPRIIDKTGYQHFTTMYLGKHIDYCDNRRYLKELLKTILIFSTYTNTNRFCM